MNAFTFAAAWSIAIEAAPSDCALVLEANRGGLLAAAMYRRRADDGGTVNVWYAAGATETDALSALVAKVRGSAVAA